MEKVQRNLYEMNWSCMSTKYTFLTHMIHLQNVSPPNMAPAMKTTCDKRNFRPHETGSVAVTMTLPYRYSADVEVVVVTRSDQQRVSNGVLLPSRRYQSIPSALSKRNFQPGDRSQAGLHYFWKSCTVYVQAFSSCSFA